MALYADSDAAPAPPRGVRALGLTSAGLACMLMAGAATITMLAPLPFWIYMPVSFTMMEAPVVLLSMMPPVGPGKSLTTSVFCPMVCNTILGDAGTPASANTGTSAAEPKKPPVQMG